MKKRKQRGLLCPQNGIALATLLVCGAVGWWFLSHARVDLSSPDIWIESISRMGWAGILMYMGLLALAIVISPIPSTPFTVAGGAVWGPVYAGIYGVIGIFIGSLLAYFIGRTLGRSAVQALTGKVVYLSNQRGELYLGWLMFVTHLVPVLPFDLISYGAGISGLSLPTYAMTTLMGIIPCTFFLTYMGSTFRVGVGAAIAVILLFLFLIIGLPWGVRRYNWLGLRDVVRIE